MVEIASRDLETILRQPGVFEVVHDPEAGLRAQVGKAVLRGPRLRRDRCTRLALATHFHRSLARPREDYAVAELFVDGSRVDSVLFEAERPAPPSPDVALGHDGDRGAPFRGRIGQIAVVNERLEGGGAAFTPEVGPVVAEWCR